eukprot:NODE_1394_length_1158_cov_0.267233.p1 type:complete len:156 gc:universal NODE_1394_length_1158_cov_0.267233:745-278(-)
MILLFYTFAYSDIGALHLCLMQMSDFYSTHCMGLLLSESHKIMECYEENVDGSDILRRCSDTLLSYPIVLKTITCRLCHDNCATNCQQLLTTCKMSHLWKRTGHSFSAVEAYLLLVVIVRTLKTLGLFVVSIEVSKLALSILLNLMPGLSNHFCN